MSQYRAINEMSVSPSLLDRITACCATKGIPNPRDVAYTNAYLWAATEGWADAWAYAVDNYSMNFNPDTGVRDDVISDAMIEAAVDAFYQPQTIVGADGQPTTRAADPTLSPEEGGPTFEVQPQP